MGEPFRPIHFVIGLLTLGLTLAFIALVTALTEGPWVSWTEVTPQVLDALPTAAPRRAGRGIAPLFTPEVRYWEPYILRWAEAYNLDPNLIATVMQIESCGHPYVRSRAGAMGLFQVMPYHFAKGEDPYDPETNARRGLAYLKRAWEKTGGDVRRTLAAYNGGFRRLEEPESAWPKETRRYVTWGLGIYQDALQGRDYSPTLAQWLAQGGQRLCRAARSVLPME